MSFRRPSQVTDNNSIEFKEGLVNQSQNTLEILRKEISDLKSKLNNVPESANSVVTQSPANIQPTMIDAHLSHSKSHNSGIPRPRTSSSKSRGKRSDPGSHWHCHAKPTTHEDSCFETNTMSEQKHHQLMALQQCVHQKLEALEKKVLTSNKANVLDNQNQHISTKVMNNIQDLEEMTKTNTKAPENHQLIQTVMSKLDALENKIAMKNALKTDSKINTNSGIVSTGTNLKPNAIPKYTYTDYVNERAKLDELIRMRKSVPVS
jgi:hypothetical protein